MMFLHVTSCVSSVVKSCFAGSVGYNYGNWSVSFAFWYHVRPASKAVGIHPLWLYSRGPSVCSDLKGATSLARMKAGFWVFLVLQGGGLPCVTCNFMDQVQEIRLIPVDVSFWQADFPGSKCVTDVQTVSKIHQCQGDLTLHNWDSKGWATKCRCSQCS